jgi:hypothetical protein
MLLATSTTIAQTTLKKVSEIIMPGKEGRNAAAIVWQPETKKYYSAFAGNTSFPFAVFSQSGELLSEATLTALLDVRGLWYNSLTEGIEGNGYGESGWAEFVLNKEGIPEDVVILFEDENQPDPNAAGVYVEDVDVVLFLSSTTGNIETYGREDAHYETEVPLHLGKTSISEAGDNKDVLDQYNTTNIALDEDKFEIGLLNVDKRQIEMYNPETGLMVRKLKLPSDAPLNKAFNFSYTNGAFWLFDIAKRTWKAYR